MTTFPKALYITAGGDAGNGNGRDFFGKESLEGMNDGNGAEDGEEIAIYELKKVQRCEVTRTLVDD